MTNIYETTIIVKPDLATDQLKSLNSSIDQFFSENNVSIGYKEDWGIKNLKSTISKYSKGSFKKRIKLVNIRYSIRFVDPMLLSSITFVPLVNKLANLLISDAGTYFYFPSVNYKNFKIFNDNFYKIYNYRPTEISILSYDAIGLIYYAWKRSGEIKSINNFNFKKDIKGKVGKFNISENKVIQKLRIYKIYDGNFTEYNF